MSHTPTPWELIEANENHGAYIVSKFGNDICDLYAMSNPLHAAVCNGGDSKPIPFSDADANAAFIVRAVNCHDELVEALARGGLIGQAFAIRAELARLRSLRVVARREGERR